MTAWYFADALTKAIAADHAHHEAENFFNRKHSSLPAIAAVWGKRKIGSCFSARKIGFDIPLVSGLRCRPFMRKHLALFFLFFSSLDGHTQEIVGFKHRFISSAVLRNSIALPLPDSFRIRAGVDPTIAPNRLHGLYQVLEPVQPKVLMTTAGGGGYALQNGAPAAGWPQTDIKQFIPKTILSKKLVGNITRKDGDTLFITFRPISTPDPFGSTAGAVNYTNTRHGEKYVYVIGNDQWARPRSLYSLFFYRSQPRFRVPFAYTAFAATAIPLRVSLHENSQGKAVSEFPTANLAFFRVWGRSLIYKNATLEKAGQRFFGIGPFVGPTLVTTTAAAGGEGRLGIVYGANAVVGFNSINLILAFGAEHSWSENVEPFSPWLGFGIGLKIVELASSGEGTNAAP